MRKLATRVGLCLVALFSVVLPARTAGARDTYFSRTKSGANVFVAPVPAPIHKVAILPFRAPTELIGSSVSDMFVTEMMRAGRYELVERSQMAKVLGETELAVAGISAAKAAELGTMLGADGVIIGTVDEYASVAHRGYSYPVVGMTVRLIECSSGKVMWSADLAKKADSAETTLGEHAREVVHEVVAGLYQKWGVQTKVRRVEAEPVIEEEPEQPPSPPAGFEVGDMGLREMTLKWSAPSEPVSTYRVERAAAADGPFEAIAEVSPRSGAYMDNGGRGDALADDTTYYYRLTAISASGLESEPTPAREGLTAPAPEPPPSVTAEATGSRAVTLTWEPSPSEGVVKYIVERAPADATEQHVKLGEVKGTSFSEGGTPESELEDRTKYIYWVNSVNRVGAVGDFAKSAEVVTLPPPAPVGGLTAGSDEVRCVPLAWQPSAEADVVRYEVHRADARDGEFEQIASVKGRVNTTYLDGLKNPGSLEDEQTWFYKIRAVNSVTAVGDESPVVSATTRRPPPVVTGLAAQPARPREVPLAWTASADEKVMGYEIHRADAGEEDFYLVTRVNGRETVSYTDKGRNKKEVGLGTLSDGTEYRYRVAAFNTANAMSPWCEPVAATTKPAPAAPATAEATTNLPRSVEITWMGNPEPDIAEFVVESAPAPGRFHEIARVEAGPTWLEYLDRGEPDGVERFYRVKAVDKDTLESLWSETAAGSTKPLPSAPANLQAELTDGGARVTWDASPEADIQEYKVWRKGLLGAQLLGTAETSAYELDTTQLGKGLSVLVTAVDSDGLESARSVPVEIRPPPAAR